MLLQKIRSLQLLWKKIGTFGTFQYIWNVYLKEKTSLFFRSRTGYPKINIFKHYEFLTINSLNDVEASLPEKLGGRKLNWLIPDFGIGSGGHLNIFRLIMYLEKSGFESTISIVGDSQFVSGKDAQESIRKHFFPINAEVIIGTSELKPANATFATSWITAYYARNLKQAGYKLYFVQDYEPYFYAHGSEYYFAEDTYRMGFHGVTAGNWLADKLSHEFSMKTTPMGFSYDHDLYYPHVRRDKIQKRVFFYSRPVTLRRGFELGILALDIVAKKYPDVDFILAGWDCSNYFIPFRHLNAGNVPVANLPDLYSQCDVALVLSLTNLSLLPLEIMACGCPVVSNKGSSVEWLLNDENALLVDLTVISLSNAIITLLEDEEMRSDLSMRGRKFASKTSWEVEAKKVVDLLNSIVIDGIT